MGKMFSKQDKDPSSEKEKLSKKIGRFFQPEPQKEKVLRHEDFDAAGDVYYAGVSAVYKVAQRILWLLFILFMILSIAFNYTHITYDNFYYLIKDFSGAADRGGSYYETLSYESDNRQRFTLYRGGLATVSPSKISVFTATGRRTLNLTSSFSSPFMESSNKYILVYDTSGTTFSIYNSFARVFTQTLEYPVTNACLADDGSFVIITRTADSRSVIKVYNKNFKLVRERSTDYFVFDIVVDSKTNTLVLFLFDAGDGTGRATISIRDISTLEEVEARHFYGEFPIACGFLENKTFAVITNSYIRILDESFQEKEISEDYSGANITGYTLTSEGVAVSATHSAQNMVYAFDKTGVSIYDESVDFNVLDIGIFDAYLFLQTEQGVKRLDTTQAEGDGQIETLSSGSGKMLIYNQKTALVCGESKAEYLIFKD